ncbi:Uncharacterised protein [Bordetella trematum]|nr:Uncharacterised protein [Bordetella trematum]
MFDVEEFTTRVLSKAEIAQDTLAFELERPEGFTFEAGQYVSLRLLDFDAPLTAVTMANGPFPSLARHTNHG